MSCYPMKIFPISANLMVSGLKLQKLIGLKMIVLANILSPDFG